MLIYGSSVYTGLFLFYNKEQMEKARIGASGNQEKMIILEKKREQYYLCKEYILTQRMK